MFGPVAEGILAEQGPLPPTIVVTGAGNEAVAVEAMRLGASDYVVKDVEGIYLDLLPAVIDQALEGQRLAQEKERAERQLRIFQQFAEAWGQGIAMADPKARITYGNHALCALAEENGPDDMIGRSFADYVHEAELPRFQGNILPAVMRDGQWISELTSRSRTGRLVPAIVNLFLIRDEDGSPECLAGVVADITAQKRAEQELRDTLEELERFNRLAIGRELRMVELKREVNEIAMRAGLAPPYDLTFAEADKGEGDET